MEMARSPSSDGMRCVFKSENAPAGQRLASQYTPTRAVEFFSGFAVVFPDHPLILRPMQMFTSGAVEKFLRNCAAAAQAREDLWIELIRVLEIRRIAEIGVYRGDFAKTLLEQCEGLTAYHMIDPWRHLPNWNKPSNHENALLEQYFQETKSKTDFAGSKRIILRGTTTEVIEQIPNGDLDFAYVDGDHTLRGIAIDLTRVYPKLRDGGFLGGDDFTSSIWEHKTSFEPTLVFPFAVYFAEAVGATIYALPFSQFCLHKSSQGHFSFVDLTGHYADTGLRNQVAPERLLKLALAERFPRIMGGARKTKDRFVK